MRRRFWRSGSHGEHLKMHTVKLAGLVVLAAAMEIGAAVGIAYVAGFMATTATFGRLAWWWLPVMAASLGAAFAGYYYADKGIYECDGGPKMDRQQHLQVVIAGFGGFFSHGGGTLDKFSLRAAGADENDANVRVTALAGLEHGVLGLIGSAAGIAVLVAAMKAPPSDFSLPWAVIPVPGFVAAFLLADRFEPRFWGRRGLKGKLGVFLRAVRFIRRLFTTDLVSRRPAALGMALFWAGDICATWCGMAAFGFRMNAAQVILGVGTGMVFTRRTGPLGGAGVLMLTLPVSLWYSGAPLAVAVVGVFCYRVMSTWLPLPLTLAQLPSLRRIGDGPQGDQHGAGQDHEPALPDRKAS